MGFSKDIYTSNAAILFAFTGNLECKVWFLLLFGALACGFQTALKLVAAAILDGPCNWSQQPQLVYWCFNCEV